MGPGLIERALHRLISLLQFLLLSCLLICAGYQSHYIFFKALYFRIQEIRVTGNHSLSQREIVRSSGLELGDLFFKYNYERVRRLIQANPRIEETRVVVKSPNTVEIQLKEREPYFRLTDGAKAYDVDKNGTVLGVCAGKSTLRDLKGASIVASAAGPSLEAAQVELLHTWVGLLEKSPLKSYTRLDIASPQRVQVQWKDQLVYVADAGTFERNSAILDLVLHEATDRQKVVNTIDLRFSSLVLKVSDPKAAATDVADKTKTAKPDAKTKGAKETAEGESHEAAPHDGPSPHETAEAHEPLHEASPHEALPHEASPHEAPSPHESPEARDAHGAHEPIDTRVVREAVEPADARESRYLRESRGMREDVPEEPGAEASTEPGTEATAEPRPVPRVKPRRPAARPAPAATPVPQPRPSPAATPAVKPDADEEDVGEESLGRQE